MLSKVAKTLFFLIPFVHIPTAEINPKTMLCDCRKLASQSSNNKVFKTEMGRQKVATALTAQGMYVKSCLIFRKLGK